MGLGRYILHFLWHNGARKVHTGLFVTQWGSEGTNWTICDTVGLGRYILDYLWHNGARKVYSAQALFVAQWGSEGAYRTIWNTMGLGRCDTALQSVDAMQHAYNLYGCSLHIYSFTQGALILVIICVRAPYCFAHQTTIIMSTLRVRRTCILGWKSDFFHEYAPPPS